MINSDRIRASAIVVHFREGIRASALLIEYSDFYPQVLRILVVENHVYHTGPCRKVVYSRSTRLIANAKIADRTCSLDASRCQAT
jgi:hypothetical protein